MAKVLACPDCGHKHSLDLLGGLDSFVCKQCSRVLAVPAQITQQRELEPDSKDNEDQDVVVLARASLDVEKNQVNQDKDNQENLKEIDPIEGLKVQPIPIPFLGQLLAWVFALPFGFFLVVLLPRIFKRGFHASDFVGVITKQGIGRYGIVITLILIWSLATVLSIFLYNSLLRRFFLARKTAK